MKINNKIKIFIKISSILLISGVFFYLYFIHNPVKSDFIFPQCPSYTLLGLNCPGCGSQRALHHIFHLDLKTAFLFNPLLVITFPFIIYLLIIQLYNFIFNKKKQVAILISPLFPKILLVIILIYFILRNIPLKIFSFLNPNI
jgi:hypothetical protein